MAKSATGSPRGRLGAMFFIQNAVWGAQVLLLSGHLAKLPLIPALGWLIARLGLPWTIRSGIVAAALRSLILARGEPVWLLVASQVLSGHYIAVSSLPRPWRSNGGRDGGMIFLLPGSMLLLAALCFAALFRGGGAGARRS